MDEGDSKNNKQIKGQKQSPNAPKRYGVDAGTFLQSIWVRCRSVFPYTTDRKFMESELRFVLYCGLLFWFLHLLYQAIK